MGQVIGHHDNAIGVDGVGESKTQRAASRPAMRPVGVAEEIGRRRGDHRDIDMYFTVLYRLPAAAMRAQHAQPAHVPMGAVVAQRAIHAAFDVMHRPDFISSITGSWQGNDALGNQMRSFAPMRAAVCNAVKQPDPRCEDDGGC